MDEKEKSLFFRLAILLMKKIFEHSDIPAATHLRLPNLCIDSSGNSANRYEIDKRDVKPAEGHVICTRPSYSPRTLVIQ